MWTESEAAKSEEEVNQSIGNQFMNYLKTLFTDKYMQIKDLGIPDFLRTLLNYILKK